MSNHAYVSIWCKDFSEPRILEHFGALLATVPFSATAPGFNYLVVRAVDATESPILEQDLRAVPLDANGVIELAKDHLNNDTAYEVRTQWDLWTYDDALGRWQLQPQPLELFCHGEDYDDGYWREFGHLEIDLGFEHFSPDTVGCSGSGGARRQIRKAPKRNGSSKPWSALKTCEITRKRPPKIFVDSLSGFAASKRLYPSTG
jgi:hypothetical protein